MDDEYTLEELAKNSGLPLRTLRYYIQEGVLQGPDTRGKFARYSRIHLERLDLIQRLKNLHLPLQQIRLLLNEMRTIDIANILKFQDMLSPYKGQDELKETDNNSIRETGSSALEYIQNLEQVQRNFEKLKVQPLFDIPSPVHPSIGPPQIGRIVNLDRSGGDQETWQKLVLATGVELHTQEPRDPIHEVKIQKLIEYARNLFGDKTKKGEEK